MAIETLLNQVNVVLRAAKDELKATGRNFNIFSILQMETAEVKTHSRFIAELLDPNGSHDQGTKFLDLFIDYLNTLKDSSGNPLMKNHISISSRRARVEIERYIGRITDTEGGRIDISISDSKNIIVIENKIYAAEGEKQMLRYSNFASRERLNSHVFFLTLWGNEPYSSDEGAKVYPISYRQHIIEWLEVCKKDLIDLPILREAITQYINLVKKITHQITNKKMQSEIQSLILKHSKEAELIANNYNLVVLDISNKIITSVHAKIETHLKTNNLFDIWEISKFEPIKSLKNRGMIWLRPKITNDNDWIIGIEDFNPLFGNLNFEKRIFAGIRSEIQSFDYAISLDQNRNQSWGSWNDYVFISDYQNQEVRLDNEVLLRLLVDEGQFELFCSHIFNEFIKYFKSHFTQLLEFCKRRLEVSEALINYSIHEVMIDQGKSAIVVVDILKAYFSKSDYSNVEIIRIWNRMNPVCLVFDFSRYSISVDVIPRNDTIEFRLFQRKGSELQEIMNSQSLPEDYQHCEGWYICDYTSRMLFSEVISDIQRRIKSIDDMLSNVK